MHMVSAESESANNTSQRYRQGALREGGWQGLIFQFYHDLWVLLGVSHSGGMQVYDLYRFGETHGKESESDSNPRSPDSSTPNECTANCGVIDLQLSKHR